MTLKFINQLLRYGVSTAYAALLRPMKGKIHLTFVTTEPFGKDVKLNVIVLDVPLLLVAKDNAIVPVLI